MADRYPGRPPADDEFDRGDQRSPAPKSDPLAELARLIGQTDPFGNLGRANQPMRAPPVDEEYDPQLGPEAEASPPPAARPGWMQRVTRQEEALAQDFPSSVHPLRGYAAAHAASEPNYHQETHYADQPSADPSRYDDALYGQLDPDAQDPRYDPAYSDDLYAYQEDGEETLEHGLKKRRGGMVTVAVVLALAVLGTGGAFAYRTFLGSPRSGEPPIIKADVTPTKVVPAPADSPAKTPDRLAPGEGTEKIVPREEQPVDVNGAPRVVLPPLIPNPAPPPITGVAPGAKPAVANALPGEEPRKIKTFTVRGDQADIAATPAAKPAPRPRTPAANANAASANAPLSLAPQGAEPAAPPRRVAANNPQAGGGYVVQVASQRNEADAQASYRALQGKYPSVLGSRTPLIKRADLGEKGVFYRAMIGPFGSPDEAAQLCGSLKTAGGQCVVQKN